MNVCNNVLVCESSSSGDLELVGKSSNTKCNNGNKALCSFDELLVFNTCSSNLLRQTTYSIFCTFQPYLIKVIGSSCELEAWFRSRQEQVEWTINARLEGQVEET